MYFAFSYILFFALDILAATKFQVLGMIPVRYLISGAGFFFVIFTSKRLSFFRLNHAGTIIPQFFFFYILFIACMSFLIASSRALQHLSIISMIHSPAMIVQTVISAILIFIILFTKQMKSEISGWMLFSVVAGFVRYGVEAFISLPFILYRYSGVLDLIMLFGWLMIIVTIVRMEYAVEV